MKEYIDAVKSGDLVEARKQFASIMEGRKDALRQELRVQLAESVRIEGETDPEDEDEEEHEDKDDKKSDDKE
ncbi:prohead core protein [Pantoea phage Phynn]|nr:prohead core protein [Pantoea phage Phynn]